MEIKSIFACLLFCFHQKKNPADAHRICETYDENFIVIRTCANWFKQFKNGDFDNNDKKHSGHPAAVEEGKLRKDGKKSWKTMENTSINWKLY